MSEMPSTVSPIITKSEWAYAALRERISLGTYKPGERLRLTEIARELGVSELPVREALRMLERDRLVVMESHRGATVADLTIERALEIIAVRTHLELLALAEAVGRHTDKDLKALASLAKKLGEAAKRGDASSYSELNRAFHRALYAPGPNQTLKSEIEGLWDRLWLTRSQSIFAVDSERMSGAQAEHNAILEALRSGDRKAVLVAAEQHREATLLGWSRLLQLTGST